MSPVLVRADDATPQAWRNGGGSTRELLAWPSPQDWRVRVSVADIESDGPFSSYPGVQRWFTVLKGTGVELSIDGVPQRVLRGDAPIAFDGGVPTECRLLDDPTRDLNLMLRGAPGALRIACDGEAWRPAAQQCGLFSAVAGRCIAGQSEIELPPYALLWFDAPPPSLAFVAEQRPASLVGWWLEFGA